MFIHPIIPNGAKRTAETRDFMFIFREMVTFSDKKKLSDIFPQNHHGKTPVAKYSGRIIKLYLYYYSFLQF